MSNLEFFVESAREAESGEWSDARAGRVLASTLLRREKQVARARFARRSLGVASATAVVVLVLLRGATSPSANASTHEMHEMHDTTTTTQPAMIAAHDLLGTGDGGYGRD